MEPNFVSLDLISVTQCHVRFLEPIFFSLGGVQEIGILMYYYYFYYYYYYYFDIIYA